MYFNQLKRLALAAGQGHFGEQNLAFQVRPLRLKQDQRTLPHLWAKLNQELGPTCVAIIGISGALHHWCVAYRVTPKTLWLLDSAGRRRISRSRCTVQFSQTRYCLEVNEILLQNRQSASLSTGWHFVQTVKPSTALLDPLREALTF
jgi:ABC-type bacteriocin/lantibiotic exporter with double-glycine peptidase domain